MILPKGTLLIGGGLVAVAIIYSMGVDPPNGQSATTPAGNVSNCRMTVTADVLNVRAAPDAKAGIVGKYKNGAEADADKVVQNGFRKLGDNRWASNEFLKPLAGRDCG
ncbi:SH3 domain-containing protein [Actinokineospora inagensis]|uniref:SH3 domain-containing protein n=1 Tax=Actinokineospora inagensis TaxID=103730 RepID=UPI0003F539DE|nr:SH3 domain-containing protein [Actinokineospora inagensis]